MSVRSSEGASVPRWDPLDIHTVLRCRNWVAELAEAADHHPDVLVHRYRRVTLTIMTHSENGTTSKDLDLAAQIESHRW